MQIEAMWRYLLDGNQARVPSGLQKQAIELKPVDRVLIYRNFLQGLSPRGIAVGFPEKAHFAWDAEDFAPRLIWHGAFIDASMHWEGRGPGAQAPLGDHVMTLPAGPSVAVLKDQQSEWPAGSPRKSGYQFEGYTLDEKGVPTFRYRTGAFEIADQLKAVAMTGDAGLERTLVMTPLAEASPLSADEVLCVRVAMGGQIENSNDEWVVDQSIRIRIREGIPLLRPVEIRKNCWCSRRARLPGIASSLRVLFEFVMRWSGKMTRQKLRLACLLDDCWAELCPVADRSGQ